MRLGKTLRIVLIAVPLLLIALVAGAVVMLRSTDFNQYKPLIAEEARKATGRDLVIAGDLDLVVSFSPAVAVDGVTFTNAEWGSRPEMVKVDRFEAQLALIPLIFGTVEVKRVVLIGADILLEVDKDGHTNFAFEATKSGESEKAAKPAELNIPIVHELVVRESRLAYNDAVSGASHLAVIDDMTVRGDGPGNPVTLLYRGSYNEAPIKADARLGAPAEALSPSEPWPVDLTLLAGGATVTVKGSIAEPTKATGLALDLGVKGEQLGDLAVLAGTEVPAMGAYSLSGKLTGDPASAIELAGLDIRLGESDITGEVTVKLDSDRPTIDANLASEMLDLAALGGAAGGGAETRPAKKSGKVFPSDPLPLEGLRAVDAKVDYRARTINANGARLSDAVMALSLAGGDLRIAPIKGALAGGGVDGSVKFDGRRKAAVLTAKLTVAKMNLGQLLKDMGSGDMVEGYANINLDVTGAGGSVAQIMANLNGDTSLVMGKGRMKTGSLQTLIGGPTQVVSNLFAGADSDYTAINCAVVRFPVKQGVATAEPLVLDTDVAAFIGEGKINLGSEKLDLLIKPDVKKTTISAAVPVRIGGTLAKPDYALDKKGVARKVGGLLGVVMFPPAAILGLGELGAGDDNPCVQRAKGGKASQKKEDSGGAAGVLKGAGEGITKGLKGLFGD